MNMIDIKECSFRYRNAAERALDGVTLSIGEGEFVGIFGTTGAGKSTLVRVLNGIVPSFFKGEFSGSVRVGNADISAKKISEMSAQVGMVFQEFESQLFSTNVEHEIAFGCENLAVEKEEIRSRVKKYVEFSGLSGFERRSASTLSGGEKQRLAIASVLSMQTPIVVMDEPTTDLDPRGKAMVFDILSKLKNEKRTTVLVEHETEEAFLLDRVIIFIRGRLIAEGSPGDILYRPGFLIENGIKPPDICLLSSLLGKDQIPYTIEQAYDHMVATGNVPRTERYEDMVRNDTRTHHGASREIISVHDLHFVYEGGKEVLRGIDLSIREGEFIAILGSNGSGKTTLVKHFNGLLKPSSGRIEFWGRDIKEEKASSIAKKVGYIFQNPDHQIYAQSVWDEVAFGPRNFGFSQGDVEERVRRSLETVQLEGREKEDPFAMTKGDRQKVAVASIIASGPEVIIMDEPTTGLDYTDQKRVMGLLKELNRKGHTVLIITHSVWLAAEYADRVIVMKDGKIVKDDTPRRLFADDHALEEGRIELPEITKLGRRFGIVTLSVDEFMRCLGKGPKDADIHLF